MMGTTGLNPPWLIPGQLCMIEAAGLLAVVVVVVVGVVVVLVVVALVVLYCISGDMDAEVPCRMSILKNAKITCL